MSKKTKIITRITLPIFVIFVVGSCQKSKYNLPDISSLTIINAVIEGTFVKLRPQSNLVSLNGTAKLAIFSGSNDVYVYPIGDSANPYCSNVKYQANSHYAYSLFVAGKKPNTQCKLVQDNISIINIADSAFRVRFVNLSPNSPSLKVTLSTSSGVNEASNLGFMDVTDFKQYSAKRTDISYTFQFRKSNDNSLVTSYTFSTIPRYASVTLALGGVIDGNPGPVIIRSTNDR